MSVGKTAYCIIAHSPILHHWNSGFAPSWPKIKLGQTDPIPGGAAPEKYAVPWHECKEFGV